MASCKHVFLLICLFLWRCHTVVIKPDRASTVHPPHKASTGFLTAANHTTDQLLAVSVQQEPSDTSQDDKKDDSSNSAAGGEHKPVKWLRVFHMRNLDMLMISAMSLILLFSAVSAYAAWLIYNLYDRYRHVKADDPDTDLSFRDHLGYHFTQWYSWNSAAKTIILMVAFLAVLMIGVCFMVILKRYDVLTATYQVFVWLVGTDGGVDEKRWTGRIIGAVMSVSGLFVFALLMTLVQDGFATVMASVDNGDYAVIERGHYVILGFTNETLRLIDELCMAHCTDGGAVIAVLATQHKTEIEDIIRKAEIDLRGSQVVVRCGQCHRTSDLKRVAAHLSCRIFVIPDRAIAKELRDAFVLQILVALGSQDWPIEGSVLAVCSLPRNRDLFQKIGGPQVEVLMLDSFIAKLLVASSRQAGLANVIGSLFGFEGSEFYVDAVPEQFVGETVENARSFYPHCILVGVLPCSEEWSDQAGSEDTSPTAQKRISCRSTSKLVNKANLSKSKSNLVKPTSGMKFASDHELEETDTLVFIAEDSQDIRPKKEAEPLLSARTYRNHQLERGEMVKHERAVETILILGWTSRISLLLIELDYVSGEGTKVIIVSHGPCKFRSEFLDKEHKRCGHTNKNLRVTQVEGRLGSRYQLEDLPVEVKECDRIFVLPDLLDEAQQVDASTLTASFQILEMMSVSETNKSIPIVAEIRDPLTKELLSQSHTIECVDAFGLPAQVVAGLAYNPSTAPVVDEIISDDGDAQIAIKELSDYIELEHAPQTLTFAEASSIVMQQRDVLIGWSKEQAWEQTKYVHDESCFAHRMDALAKRGSTSGNNNEFEINPKGKTEARRWFPSDKFVVISPSDEQEERSSARRRTSALASSTTRRLTPTSSATRKWSAQSQPTRHIKSVMGHDA